MSAKLTTLSNLLASAEFGLLIRYTFMKVSLNRMGFQTAGEDTLMPQQLTQESGLTDLHLEPDGLRSTDLAKMEKQRLRIASHRFQSHQLLLLQLAMTRPRTLFAVQTSQPL